MKVSFLKTIPFLVVILISCTVASEAAKLFRKQSGTLTFAGTGGLDMITVTILPVKMGSSFLLFPSTSNGTSSGNRNSRMLVGGELTNSTTLTFTRTNSAEPALIHWQVVEFVSGVTVQRGTTTDVGAATDVTLASTVDLEKTFVIATGYSVATNFGADDTFTADLISPTTLRLSTGSGFFRMAYWQVIQYEDAVVKKVTATLSDAMLSATATISPAITNLNQAMVVSSLKVTGGASHTINVLPSTELTDASTVTFARPTAGTPTVFTSLAYVVEFTDNTFITHGSGTIAANTMTQDVEISSTLISSVVISPGNMGRQGISTATDRNLGYVSIAYEITQPNKLRMSRGPDGAFTSTGAYQIVTFESEERMYYSLADGDWDDNTKWSLSSDGSSGPLPDGEFPSRTDDVVIRAGHTITVNEIDDNYYPGLSPGNLIRSNVGPFVSSNADMFYHFGDILIKGTLNIVDVEAMVDGYTEILPGGTLTASSNLINTGYLEAAVGSTLSTLDDLILTGYSVTIIDSNTTTSDDLYLDYTDAILCGTGTAELLNGSGSKITYTNGATIDQVCSSFTVTCRGAGCNSSFPTEGTNPFILGNTGPGGVGNSSNNNLWLMANKDAYTNAGTTLATNNQGVQQWGDQSGNAKNAIELSNKPSFFTNIFNGQPVIRFDAEDRLLAAGVATANSASVFVAAQYFTLPSLDPGLVHASPISKEFGITSTKSVALWLNSSSATPTGRIIQDDGTLADVPSNSALAASTPFLLLLTADSEALTVNHYVNNVFSTTTGYDGTIRSWTQFGIGRQANLTWDGDIAEVISYRAAVNTAQATIINNYLSAKYGIPLAAAQDVYTMDNDLGTPRDDYDFEVAGIGRAADGTSHQDAKGTGIVRMWNSSNMNRDEYLLWGHDNATLIATTRAAGSVDGIMVRERLVREWAVSETVKNTDKDMNTNGDVGTVNISFDLTAFPKNFLGSNLRLLIDRNGNGFQDNDVAPRAGAFNDDIITFSHVNFQHGDRFTLGNTDINQPLPVTLVSFTAVPQPFVVMLEWRTASEINNNYFDVQRSLSAEVWENVARVQGAGNSTQEKRYQVRDEAPLDGKSYYRLKQTDYDGRYAYSPVVMVDYTYAPPLQLFPNPSTGIFTLKNEQLAKEQVQLVNMLGHNVPFTLISGENTWIDISSQPIGIYIIRIASHGVVRSIRVVKK